MKKLIGIVVVIILITGYVFWQSGPASAPKGNPSATSTADSKVTKPESTIFDKHKYSLTDPASIWVIVNKKHPLNPKTYTPADLVTPDVPLRVPGNFTMQVRKITASALEKMFASAKKAGYDLMVSSGYRSYSYQVTLYNSYVKSEGKASADTFSARPGYSEHQTGLAADIGTTDHKCEVEQCFGATPAGEWVAANAYKFGFVIRYPKGDESITGYTYEPWHVRYIGVPAATQMHKQGIATLEHFFDVSGGDYPD